MIARDLTTFENIAALRSLPSVGVPSWDETGRRWRVQYSCASTSQRMHKSFSVSKFGTKTKAKRAAFSFCDKILDDYYALRTGAVTERQYQVANNSRVNLGKIRETYYKRLETKQATPKHRKECKRVIEAACESGGWSAPKDINQQDVDLWLSDKSPTTHNIYLRTLRAFTRWLEKVGYVVEDPLKYAEPVNVVEEARPIRAMTMDELNLLLGCDEIPVRRKRWYRMAARTGLRQKELERLKWHDIDWNRRKIKVVRRKGKGKAVMQEASISLELLEELRTFCQHPNAKVFPKGKVKPRTFYWDLERAGIEKIINGKQLMLRSLRPTFNTHLAIDGTDLQTRQKLMRHSDVSLTSNTYMDADQMDLHSDLDRLDRRDGVA